jgi:uncharacterized protein YndB with AHSA1/START domain
MTDTDRIEKKILIRAPRSRVWEALTDSRQFGTWFRAALENDFAVGQQTVGKITHPGYEHIRFEVMVERMEPPQRFAFRWHPYPIDPKVDYSAEPPTLVEFRLEETPEGTLLTVVESGFDRLPPERRDEAFRMNERGWNGQAENLRKHVAG